MATTLTITRLGAPAALNHKGYKKAKVVVDWDTYATGGISFDPSTNRLGTIIGVEVAGVDGAVTWDFDYDLANNKLMAFVRSTGAEVGNGVDLSSVDVTCWVYYY